MMPHHPLILLLLSVAALYLAYRHGRRRQLRDDELRIDVALQAAFDSAEQARAALRLRDGVLTGCN